MVKAHTPINWENEPSYNTPLNAANLNKMDSEIGILDDRIIAQDTSKLDKSTANTMVKDVTFNESTGIFTITLLNGSTKTLDTKLEKISTNFRYDYSTQKLILTLVDGTTQEIDMSALLTQYEFTDSATIDFSVGSDGKITATIKNGSITENMLQPNYLAEIKVESAKAETNAIKSQSYAVGGTSSRQNEDIDNARYYYEQAKSISESFSGALVPMGTVAFEDLPSLEDAVAGWMYNISNEFVTTDDFKEGAGHTIPLGANIFKTVDNFWDLLSGSSSDLIVDSVEGNNPTINNSTDGNLIYLKNDGYTEQDGTPTSDTPVNIQGLGEGGTIKVVTCGKNLIEKVTLGLYVSLNSSGALWAYEQACATEQYIKVIRNKQYTLSCSLGNWSCNVACYDVDKTFIKNINNKRTFAIDDDSIKYIRVGIYNNEEVAINSISVQLELGGVATPIKEYTETKALIPISSPLYKGDYIEIFADGSGQIYRKMGSIVYDGSNDEGWYQESTRFYSAKIADATQCDTSTSGKKAYSNQLKLVYTGETSNEHNDNSFTIASTKNLYLRINSITDISSLRAYLSSNPLHVVYTLETPTKTPLTAEQVAEFMKLQTFKGVTNVTADGEVTVRYYCNNDSGETVARVSEKANNSVSKSSIANNLTTTTEGMVLDATQGKTLNDKISTLNNNLEWKTLTHNSASITSINGDIFVDIITNSDKIKNANEIIVAFNHGQRETYIKLQRIPNVNLSSNCATYIKSSDLIMCVECMVQWSTGSVAISCVANGWGLEAAPISVNANTVMYR